jgi:predicted PurR-regulated permease PerM
LFFDKLKTKLKDMDTLSFILGMSSVVVIAIAVVAVMGFFKVRNVEKHFNEYKQNFTVEFDNRTKDIRDNMNHVNDDLHRRIDNTEREIFSQLDSRLDKLENKLTDTIKNGCDPVKK